MAKKTMNEMVERLLNEAREMPVTNQLNVPMAVLLMEAIQIGACVEKYWEPAMMSDGFHVRPGLKDANLAGETRLKKEVAQEILELQQLVMQAHVDVVLAVKPRGEDSPAERARFLLGEISGALGYLFDDGVTDDNDAKLAQLEAQFGEMGTGMAELAPALFAYATLAQSHREALEGLGAFDATLIDEAFVVVKNIYERPFSMKENPEAEHAIVRRNQLAALLRGRIGLVRKIARYAFRAHPAILREMTSLYLRRQTSSAGTKPVLPSVVKMVR
ncbi:MAG: hypothetical protein U0165_18885 [Polyangiaceae bacterium]